TAVRARWPDSMAARMPAPPAPTMTTSYSCTCIGVRTPLRASGAAERGEEARVGARGARLEREDDEGAQHHDDRGCHVEHHLQREARAGTLCVVEDDRADAVRAVDHREPQQREVPDLPERAGPLAGDEAEVQALHAVTQPQVDDEVSEDEDDQDDAGQAHEEPGAQLEAGALGLVALVAGAGCGDGGRTHQNSPPSELGMWRHRKPTMTTSHRPIATQKSVLWCFVPPLKKSTAMTRRPLKAWKAMAPTSTTSPNAMRGDLYVSMTAL